MGFQQGLSGLDSSSKYLEVIGNNVANANTVGFKSSTAEFSDIFANSLASSNIQAGIGGRTSNVAQQFAQGSLTTTNNPLDLALQGNGFFRVIDDTGSVSYTRNGQFELDRNGFIVNNGQHLAGYSANNNNQLVTGVTPGPIQLQTTQVGARATGGTTGAGSGVQLQVNLDSRAPVLSRGNKAVTVSGLQLDNAAAVGTAAGGSPYTLRVADSTGVYHTLNVQVDNTAPHLWQVSTAIDGGTLTPATVLRFDPTTGSLASTTPSTVTLTGSNGIPFQLNLNFAGAAEVATASAAAGVISTDTSASATPTVQITNANLSPTSAAATTVTYPPATATPPYLTMLSPEGNPQQVVVTLTASGPGTNSWVPSVTVNGSPYTPTAPATIANLVFSSDGKLISGSPLPFSFTTVTDVTPITMNAQIDLSNVTQAAGATSNGTFAVRSTTPVSSTDPTTFSKSTSATVYDSQGGAHTETYFFTKVAPNTWEVQTAFDNGTPAIQPNFVVFKADGTLASGAIFATNNIIAAPGGAQSPLSFNTDLTTSTQFGGEFGVNKENQDGYSPGTITGLSIGKDGLITGNYSNGQNRTIGQIVLYNFANPQGAVI